MRRTTDICVIGAGAAGLSVAAGAAQLGARVTLIEAGEMGGDCLNTGCVPSKALIAAAARAEAVRTGGPGIAGAPPQVDFAAVRTHVQATIAAISPHDSQARFEGLGVRVIRARARFAGPDRVEAAGEVIRARRFVVATGGRPALPPLPGLGAVPYLTNESLWDLTTLPAHLIVLGGGPIGLEMAQAFRRLGARVTVIEAARALAREDPELAAIALAALRAEGVEIREETRAEAVRRVGEGIAVTVRGEEITGSHLLVAAGRRPATEGLGLDAAGVETTEVGTTEGGAIRVDAGLRSSNRRVFAIGDVAGGATGGVQFTHAAGYQAGLVVRRAALGLPARLRSDHLPRVTYTAPELAQIGPTEAEARSRWPDIEVIRAPLAANDRARAEGQGAGLLKVVLRKGRPVGAGIAAPGAGETIALWSHVIAHRQGLGAIAGTILPYPTLAEVSKQVTGTYFSVKLFDNALVKAWVRLVQGWG